jgi:hypothetical protein
LTKPSIPPETENTSDAAPKRPGVNLFDIISFVGIITVVLAAVTYMFTDAIGESMTNHINSGSEAFEYERAQPVDAMMKIIHHPMKRAVFVPATENGPFKGLICAETLEGVIELYHFDKPRGYVTSTKMPTSEKLEAVMPAFCEDAFSRIK